MTEGQVTARNLWLQNFGARLRPLRECCEGLLGELGRYCPQGEARPKGPAERTERHEIADPLPDL